MEHTVHVDHFEAGRRQILLDEIADNQLFLAFGFNRHSLPEPIDRSARQLGATVAFEPERVQELVGLFPTGIAAHFELATRLDRFERFALEDVSTVVDTGNRPRAVARTTPKPRRQIELLVGVESVVRRSLLPIDL